MTLNKNPGLSERLRLYLVADPEHANMPLPDLIRCALQGGITSVQLRAKQLPDGECYALALKLREIATEAGALFLVNDRVDLAMAAGADGVHLGITDLPLVAARSLAGSEFVIGYSPETAEQLRDARAMGADYLGIGPVFGTHTKPDAGSALGLERFSALVAESPLPVVGIGGIDHENAASVLQAGASGVAVVSAISKSADPLLVAKLLSRAIHGANDHAH